MAARRILLLHHGGSPVTFSSQLMGLGVALFGVMFCAITMIMMCASEDEIPRKIKKQSKRFAKACYGLFDEDYYNYNHDYNPTIVHYDYQQQEVVGEAANPAVQQAAVVSANPGDGGNDVAEEQQEVSGIWKKKILMGGKCQLPEFSGVIIYDSAGNLVSKKPSLLALPWK